MPLWDGRFSEGPDALVLRLSESVSYDRRLYPFDIQGSIAHSAMLARQGIIPQEDADAIRQGLEQIKGELDRGEFAFKTELEDIHMNIESRLTELIGAPGARLHTGRSRNDQVATDERLYLRHVIDQLRHEIREMQKALCELGSRNIDAILPGFTHLQHAQPVLFAHHLLAYVEMLERDRERLADTRHRINRLPLGAGALAGSTLPLDREFVAKELGFEAILQNSMDAVADRDCSIEFLADLALVAMHLSRFSEDIAIWFSQEFAFIEIGDSFTTGSSLMPQKKNPDMAELCRGKTGRVYGDLIALLTTLKGLPLAYNKDMQEDKEAVFDCVDTTKLCLQIMAPMLATMKAKPENMLLAAQKGFINATDLADYLTKKGVPFRSAYKISGQLVAYCIAHDTVLEQLPLETYKTYSDVFEDDLYTEISLKTCVARRISAGGTGPASVQAQLDSVAAFLAAHQ